MNLLNLNDCFLSFQPNGDLQIEEKHRRRVICGELEYLTDLPLKITIPSGDVANVFRFVAQRLHDTLI